MRLWPISKHSLANSQEGMENIDQWSRPWDWKHCHCR